MNYKIVIWGVGNIYNKHVNLLKYFEMTNQIKVVALTATQVPNFHYVDGYPVIFPYDLKNIYYDYIIVMNDKYYKDIIMEAEKYGVLREKVLPYRIIEIPFFDFQEYMTLKESKISIISNNCWAGIVYHTLGLECCSPFKNLFVEDEDYIKLLQNLEYYMLCDLEFNRFEVDIHSNQKYPVMNLGDINIHCNHDSVAENAIENWNRRRQNLNYDNLFIEIYTEKKEIANRFLELKQYSKKICIVPFAGDKKGLVQLKLYPGQKEFYEVVNSSANIGRNSLNYKIIDLLNLRFMQRSN